MPPVLFATLLLLCGPAATQETAWVGLSADISIAGPSGADTGGRLYIDAPGMRIENRMDAKPDAVLSKEDPHGN